MLADWDWYKTLSILGSPDGAKNPYQLPIHIYRSAGTDGLETIDGIEGLKVYLGTNCEADYDDIRFTKADGDTLLYACLKAYDSNSAIVWVKFESLPASPDTLGFYLFYGNSGAAANWSSENTFTQYEGFEWGSDGDEIDTNGGSVTWTTQAGTPEIDTGQYYTGSRSGLFIAADSAHFPLVAGNTYSIMFRGRKNDAARLIIEHGNGTKKMRPRVYSDEKVQWTGDGGDGDTLQTVGVDTWFLLEFNNINFTTYLFDIWLNGTKIQDDADMLTSTDHDDQLWFFSTPSANFWIDEIIIRVWTANPPTLDAWGEETSNVAGWTNISKVNGIASASISKVNGIAVASIAKINGVAV